MSLIPSSTINTIHLQCGWKILASYLPTPWWDGDVRPIITPSPTGSHSNQSDCGLYLIKGIIWGVGDMNHYYRGPREAM
jgi:hypothetical protein